MEREKEHGTWVPEHIDAMTHISAIDKLILSTVRFLSTLKNGCFISREALAAKHGVSVNVVKRSLMKLKKNGYIDSVQFNGRSRKILYLIEDPLNIGTQTKEDVVSSSNSDGDSVDVEKSDENENNIVAGAESHQLPVQICTRVVAVNNLAGANLSCTSAQIDDTSRCHKEPPAGAELHRPIIEKNYKRIKEEIEKIATVVAPSTNSISNSENQNQKPEIQNAEYGNTRKQEDKANQPSLQELDFSVSNPTSVGGPTTADATATTDNDKKPRRKRGGTNAITADEFFNMLPAQQRQAAIKTLLTEFIDMRNAKKKPVTLNSAKQFVREFKKYSDVVLGVAIQRTLKGGWQGLFVPEQHNFANAYSSDINAYRDLVEQCILDEDPEEKRNRLLRQKEQEQLEIQEEYRRSQQRQQASAIASEINELPTNKPIVSEQHGVIGMSFYRDSKWVDEYKPGFDASTPRVKHDPAVQPVNRTNVHDVHNASDASSVPSNGASTYPKLVSIDANFHSAKPNHEEDAKDMLVAASEKNENRRQEIERKKKEWLKLINAKIAEMNAEKEKNGEEVEHVF